MYKLLSRALEARSSCSCSFCSPVRPGIARKVNTSPVRQRLRLGDVATIVYGTVLGTAAFYNGTSKKRRREAMDNAIKGVMLDNQAVLEDQEARLKALGFEGSETAPGTNDAAVRTPRPKEHPIGLLQTIARPATALPVPVAARSFSTSQGRNHPPAQNVAYKTVELETQAQTAEESARSPSDELSRMRTFESIFPEERVVGKTLREAWNDITLIPNKRNTRIREHATFCLVMELANACLARNDLAKHKDPVISFVAREGITVELGRKDIPYMHQKIKDVRASIGQLKAALWESTDEPDIEPLPCPQYHVYERYEGESSTYHTDLKLQQEKLIDILCNVQDPQALISEICTFLLSQTSAPNIHIINLLLIGFLDLQWFAAASVVASAASNFVMNNNEVTDLAILEYFHLARESDSFDRHRMCMLGADGRVTRAAFRPGQLVPDFWSPEQLVLQVRERNKSLTLTTGLKAGWTIEAFTIVIVDLLSRGKLLSAFGEVTTMRISGLRESPEILDAFLQYSVVKQDWDVAVKTWIRYGTLGYKKSTLTWYWMLQACATCKQPESFEKVVVAGQQEQGLSMDIVYRMENFVLSRVEISELQDCVRSLRAVQHRIPVPGMPHRDIHLQAQDMIQLPSLKQTMLMASLQYVKLRSAMFGLRFDHYSGFGSLEADLKDLLLQFPRDISALKRFLSDWDGYSTKVEAIVAGCRSSYTDECNEALTEIISRLALAKTSAIESDGNIAQARSAFANRPPASAEFYKLVARQDKLLSRARDKVAQEAAILTPKAEEQTQSATPESALHPTSTPAYQQSFTGKKHTRETWLHYESMIGSETSRRLLRASSIYASARYWNRVLHPKSPANLISVAVSEEARVQQASPLRVMSTQKPEEIEAHADVVDSPGLKGKTEAERVVQGDKGSTSTTQQSSLKYVEDGKDNQRLVQDGVNSTSSRLVDPKKKWSIESSWIRLNAKQPTSSASETDKNSVVHDLTTTDKLHLYSAWQSLKPSAFNQQQQQQHRQKQEKKETTTSQPASSLGEDRPILPFDALPGLVGLQERARYV